MQRLANYQNERMAALGDLRTMSFCGHAGTVKIAAHGLRAVQTVAKRFCNTVTSTDFIQLHFRASQPGENVGRKKFSNARM
jgi:hypothetical protein